MYQYLVNAFSSLWKADILELNNGEDTAWGQWCD